MTAYHLTHLRIPNGQRNTDALDYLEQVEATFQPHGGKYLAFTGDVEVMEGAWPGSVVLLEFPDTAAARRWYHSPEYQAIIGLRTSSVVSDVVLVDSVAPDFTAAAWAREMRAAG